MAMNKLIQRCSKLGLTFRKNPSNHYRAKYIIKGSEIAGFETIPECNLYLDYLENENV